MVWAEETTGGRGGGAKLSRLLRLLVGNSVVWTSLQKPGKAGVEGRLVGDADAKSMGNLGCGSLKAVMKGLRKIWGWGGLMTHSNMDAFCGLDSWAGAAAVDIAGPHPAAGRCPGRAESGEDPRTGPTAPVPETP